MMIEVVETVDANGIMVADVIGGKSVKQVRHVVVPGRPAYYTNPTPRGYSRRVKATPARHYYTATGSERYFTRYEDAVATAVLLAQGEATLA